jgi:hypothetical protein
MGSAGVSQSRFTGVKVFSGPELHAEQLPGAHLGAFPLRHTLALWNDGSFFFEVT